MSNACLSGKLERMVAELALPGGRVVGSVGHEIAATWVQARLGAVALDPYAGHDFCLLYEREGEKFRNIVGRLPGANRSLSPVLIGAHYDSVIPYPCADDNAAAVAIALAAAAILAEQQRERDIVIALFDAEEPPYFMGPAMGSVRFCADQVDSRGFHAAIILDLVGHDVAHPKFGLLTPPSLKKLVVIQGAESHPDLAATVSRLCMNDQLSVVAALNRYAPDMSDHYAFRQMGTPFLFLTCGQWPHYHRPSDTPEKLNYRKMAAITELLCTAVEDVSTAEMTAAIPLHDFTAPLESDSIRRAFGPLLRVAGLKTMETRTDVDAFAALMESALLA